MPDFLSKNEFEAQFINIYSYLSTNLGFLDLQTCAMSPLVYICNAFNKN